jgi:hypothetical protein
MKYAGRLSKGSRTTGRSLWSASLRWSNAAGLVCGVAVWGWAAPATVACSIAVVGGLCAWSVWASEEGGWPIRRSIDVGVSAGLVVTGLGGLVAALGALGLVVVLVLGGTSPIHPNGMGPQSTLIPAVLEEPRLAAAATSLPRDCEGLDSAELAMAWRRSFVLLQRAASKADRLAAVEIRQRYLDELCRRYPEGIASWLASGARASSNPMPFIGEQPPRSD